jgi:hypothetical protein
VSSKDSHLQRGCHATIMLPQFTSDPNMIVSSLDYHGRDPGSCCRRKCASAGSNDVFLHEVSKDTRSKVHHRIDKARVDAD